MAVGQGALLGGMSYLAVGRENVFKTYNTCTAGLPVLSASMKTMVESKVLEMIDRSRTYTTDVRLSKRVEGELEGYFFAEATAAAYLLQNAFGGTITSATATGETVGGGGFEHTLDIGNFDQSISSLCMNVRKGDSAGGKVFEYNGIRVNEFALAAEIDEALKFNVSMIAVDSTQTSNDVASALTTSAFQPLTFVDGRISIENSLASLTSSSYWHVQSVELGWNNSLKNDAAAGRIGSNVLDVLPVGMATFNFKVTMRFDTMTAYSAMLAGTTLSGQFEFQGTTLSGSAVRRSLKLTMPHLTVIDAGDPEIGGPDEILTSEVTFQVLRDNSSATGYAMRAVLRNAIASY